MTVPKDNLGLAPIGPSGSKRAVVIAHGIRQTRDALAKPFAATLASQLNQDTSVFVYGYNYNRPLVENGKHLAHCLATDLSDRERIDLVGYSMGGLVSRLAVVDRPNGALHTIVTLATPNTGALSNAELATLGQLGLGMITFISPLWPRAEGIVDLTRVSRIMRDSADRLRESGRDLGRVRYASIPALFYNDQRPDVQLGPSVALSGVQALFFVGNFKRKFSKMERPHDGIVTERSANIARNDTHIWNEMELLAGDDREPRRLHAVTDACVDHDHSSIIGATNVARLVGNVLDCRDWSTLCKFDDYLKGRIKTQLS